MNSWNLMTKSVGKKDKSIIDNYINHEKKNSVLILGSPINMEGKNPDYAPSKQVVDKVMNIDKQLYEKYPTNKFYASQGGAKKMTGSALYNKNSNIIMDTSSEDEKMLGRGAYRMRESTKRFLEGGGLTSSDYRPEYKMADDSIISKGLKFVGKNILYPILKPLLKAPKRKEKVEKIDYYGGKKVGGKKMKDMTPAELQALDDARVANAIWAKSRAGKEYKANIAELTPKERLSQARNTAREYRKNVYEPKIARMEEEYQTKLERQKQEASRQQLGEEVEFQKAERRRLAEEARKKKGNIFDDIANVAVGELVNLIPAPKVVKDVLKKGTQEGYKALSNTMQGKGKRKPSEWNIKVKAYMNKHNCSMKEALQGLKK
jgi:hypothetical protein